MNVFFPFVGNKIGGSDISATLLINELKKKKKFKIFIFLHTKGSLANYFQTKGMIFLLSKNFEKFSKLESTNFLFDLITSLPTKVKLLRKHKIDIVHTNENYTHYQWSLAAKISGCKVVLHKRNTDNSKKMKLFLLLADKVVSISEFIHNKLPARVKEKSCMVYNPFNFDPQKFDQSNIYKKIKEKKKRFKIVGFVSNFSDRKRVLFFVKVAKVLSEKTDNFFFVMLGRNILSKIREDKETSRIIKRIYAPGFINDPENLIKLFDVIVCPAINEPFGRVLIESLNLKIPIVASNSGAHKEIIRKKIYGSIVEADDCDQFVKAIIKSLNIKKNFLEAARSYAKKKFNKNLHKKKIIEVYESLIKSS